MKNEDLISNDQIVEKSHLQTLNLLQCIVNLNLINYILNNLSKNFLLGDFFSDISFKQNKKNQSLAKMSLIPNIDGLIFSEDF